MLLFSSLPCDLVIGRDMKMTSYQSADRQILVRSSKLTVAFAPNCTLGTMPPVALCDINYHCWVAPIVNVVLNHENW